jgi:hypothetical protein
MLLGRLVEIASAVPVPVPALPSALPGAPPTRVDFQGIDFLVGGIWTTSPMPGSISAEAVGYALNGFFLASTVMSVGNGQATLGNGFMGVDPATQLLKMWAFCSNGNVIQLTQQEVVVAVNTNGVLPLPTWIFEGTLGALRIRQTLTQEGATSMMTVTETWVSGKWTASPPLTYTRTSS